MTPIDRSLATLPVVRMGDTPIADDLLLLIASHLKGEDVVKFAWTTRRCKQVLLNSPWLWERLFQRSFGLTYQNGNFQEEVDPTHPVHKKFQSDGTKGEGFLSVYKQLATLRGDIRRKNSMEVIDRCSSAEFIFHGDLLLYGHTFELKAWNVKTKQMIVAPPPQYKKFMGRAFSQVYGDFLYSIVDFGIIEMINLNDGKNLTLGSHPDEISILEVHKNYLLSYSTDLVKIWDLDSKKEINTFKVDQDERCDTFFGTMDGDFVYLMLDNETIEVWDRQSGQFHTRFAIESDSASDDEATTNDAHFSCFQGYGGFLFSGGSDNKIRIWDPKSKQLIKEFDGIKTVKDDDEICSLLVDNGILYVRGLYSINIWDIENPEPKNLKEILFIGKNVLSFKVHQSRLYVSCVEMQSWRQYLKVFEYKPV